VTLQLTVTYRTFDSFVPWRHTCPFVLARYPLFWRGTLCSGEVPFVLARYPLFRRGTLCSGEAYMYSYRRALERHFSLLNPPFVVAIVTFPPPPPLAERRHQPTRRCRIWWSGSWPLHCGCCYILSGGRVLHSRHKDQSCKRYARPFQSVMLASSNILGIAIPVQKPYPGAETLYRCRN
jgi:hypothetical protein